ncbi:MAG: taurine dioxygenase [Alphaproteobacteria bacterium]|jgi:taurine dioxygenase
MNTALKNSTAVKMRPLSAQSGIEILGVDLREPLPEQVLAEVIAAFNQWGVIFFRDQDLTPDQQIAFARQFGTVTGRTHPSTMGSLADHPELSEIHHKPGDSRNTGGFWHTDQCFLPDPPLGSALYARQLPSVGGDTLFTHMGAACDRLSDGLKATLRTLRAIHVRLNFPEKCPAVMCTVSEEEHAMMRERYTGVEASHPVIGRHPGSGREILYLNHIYSDRFDGWTREESRPLIEHVCNLASQPENMCRFHWAPGSLALWDNRAVLHYALDDYPDEHRLMHRCIVRGPWLESV